MPNYEETNYNQNHLYRRQEVQATWEARTLLISKYSATSCVSSVRSAAINFISVYGWAQAWDLFDPSMHRICFPPPATEILARLSMRMINNE